MISSPRQVAAAIDSLSPGPPGRALAMTRVSRHAPAQAVAPGPVRDHARAGYRTGPLSRPSASDEGPPASGKAAASLLAGLVDLRERMADDRDRAADARDRLADSRDCAADARDEAADAREARAARTSRDETPSLTGA